MRAKNACAAASIGAMLVAIGLPLTAMSASAVGAAVINPTTTTFPADNARRGAMSGHITATFTEPVHIDATTVFTLKDDAGTVVPAAVRQDPLTKVVTLDPTAKLPVRTHFNASLTGVLDDAGNTTAEKTWSFTTAKSETESYANRMYEDLFNREIDDNGALHWEAELNDLTDDNRKVGVSNALTYSPEFRSTMIRDSYSQFLGRTPDAAGLNTWLGQMSRGITVSQMQAGFIASPEYFNKAGSTNALMVTQMYKDVLGRTASSADVTAWKAKLDDRLVGRNKIAMGILLSTEHLGTVVDDHYQNLLGRGLDPSGRQTWVNILGRGGRDEAIIGGITASAEYYTHN